MVDHLCFCLQQDITFLELMSPRHYSSWKRDALSLDFGYGGGGAEDAGRSSAALSITDDLPHRREPPGSARTRHMQCSNSSITRSPRRPARVASAEHRGRAPWPS